MEKSVGRDGEDERNGLRRSEKGMGMMRKAGDRNGEGGRKGWDRRDAGKGSSGRRDGVSGNQDGDSLKKVF